MFWQYNYKLSGKIKFYNFKIRTLICVQKLTDVHTSIVPGNVINFLQQFYDCFGKLLLNYAVYIFDKKRHIFLYYCQQEGKHKIAIHLKIENFLFQDTLKAIIHESNSKSNKKRNGSNNHQIHFVYKMTMPWDNIYLDVNSMIDYRLTREFVFFFCCFSRL